ncbi:MoxR family ATPase [bacterium]|nr:MoxR family ATPase [bacterium]
MKKVCLLKENMEKVIIGKPLQVDMTIACMLARGHLLLEDVPGTGKTTLAKALARSIEGSFQRIQSTPDLLPADITGTFVYNQKTGEFQFRPGPVFADVVLADEINRATPRTQSALLECMEEYQVTLERTTFKLPPSFMVIATQNPIEFQGTYPLPEAQKDRFMMRLKLGYLEGDEEKRMLLDQTQVHPLETVSSVITTEDVLRLQKTVRGIHIEDDLLDYIVRIVGSTRTDSNIHVGASPRGSLGLYRAGQAIALVRGRDYVIPHDIKEIAESVLAHRMILKPQAGYSDDAIGDLINTLLAKVSPMVDKR